MKNKHADYNCNQEASDLVSSCSTKKLKTADIQNVEILHLIIGNRKFNLSTHQYNLNKTDTIYFCNECFENYGEEISYNRHKLKCTKYILGSHVVYKEDQLVVYKLFGANNISACQSLCILGKSFIKHKTLYWDIDNYNFYLMYDQGNFIGYFSDEMFNESNNLSCILVLPDCQRKGYGMLLVDLSCYFKRGTCERPLSKDGEILFKKYWKNKVYSYLKLKCGQNITINKMSEQLNMSEKDVVEGLKLLNCKIENEFKLNDLKTTQPRFLNKKYIIDN
ncbi:hypothetical protein P3W45_000919 [Vairimorpha bombi]|jgi:hypothetical protein